MIIPVKCFTCGNILGNKYLFYLEKVAELKQDRQIDNENIQYFTNEKMDKSVEGEVLDTLNLNRPCCRRHMLTHVDVFS